MSDIDSFQRLGLSQRLCARLLELGYQQPTPIQSRAIPAALAGHDLVASARTGTGKTAAFALPILQRLIDAGPPSRTRGRPKVLVLTPTRELASQVEGVFSDLGRTCPIRCTTIFGGVNINRQFDALQRGVDVVVATPGRLLDHTGQGSLHLSGIETLVLDEADRMLDMGFIRDIRRILAQLPAKRQNLLFSATFSDEIRQLANGLLVQPEVIDIAERNSPAEAVRQTVHLVATRDKHPLLRQLFIDRDWQQVLVFTRTKRGANRLAEKLSEDGIAASAIHGNKSQAARTRALADFKQQRIRALVATDIAARGLDIEQLPQVVNYELPHVPEDYVHRIGRTGRAGSPGAAVSLVDPEERKLLSGIERLIRTPIEQIRNPAFTATPPPAPQPSVMPVSHRKDSHTPPAAPSRRRRSGPRTRVPATGR
mgnify:CR=1 FL=1